QSEALLEEGFYDYFGFDNGHLVGLAFEFYAGILGR
ncbi:MAG: hypothetical protein EZS28_038971, partial [Streblomastix strix]